MLSYSQQNKSLLRDKIIFVDNRLIQIDTFSIKPNFIKLIDKSANVIPKDKYKVNFVDAQLILLDFKKYKNQYIHIYYQVYPEEYRKTYQTFFKNKTIQDSLMLPVFSNENVYHPKPFEGLKTKGNIRRGISVGNNQSLVMQSGLDLKIEGNLSDKIKIKAVLSDDNLPQAYAGISKSYKDFNRIYMQLSGNKWQVTGGDLLLKQKNSNFLKFSRKTQGINFSIGNKSKFTMIGGIVEGQYNRMKFSGIDGNQGPYLLVGKHGETYIFVIPESENVFVNGKLLTREKEYTIHYETGELIFNTDFPITSNHRISVEFNYSNQNYLRYLNYNSFEKKNKSTSFKFYTFLEQDSKNKTLLFDLTPEQIQNLRAAGDKSDNLIVLSAKETTYNPNKILYKKVVVGNDFYFEYTTDNISHLFEVRFSFVGKNKGSYKIEKLTAIGKIYKFSGAGNGDYEPFIKLTAPISKQYYGTQFRTQITKKTNINTELIINNNDENLFSKIDDKNNIGGAFHFDFNSKLKNDSIKQLSVFGKYDFTHRNFYALDAYRDVEFIRRWQIDSIFGKQHFADIGVSYNKNTSNLVSGIKYFQLRDTLNATQIYMSATQHYGKIHLLPRNSLSFQKSPSSKMLIVDTDNKININFGKWNLLNTLHFEKRDREINNKKDTLNYGYSFAESKIQKKDSSKISFELGVRISKNDSVINNNFSNANKDFSIFGSLHKKYKTGLLQLYSNYRKTQSYFRDEQREFINFKLNWKQFFYKSMFLSQLKIETFNGNILQDEILFVETPSGQGNYQWNDYNGNGIKEINEFEIAVFSDQANYIRVVLPSKKLVPTQNNTYAWHFVINPSVVYKNKFISRFYNILHLETKHQSVQKSYFEMFVLQPKTPILLNNRIQNDLFINRTQKKYFIHIELQKTIRQQLLLIGKQSLSIERILFETRHEFLKNIRWSQKMTSSINKQASENYASKNYKLRNKKIEEAFSFVKLKKHELKIFYVYKNKINQSGNEILIMNKFGLQYLGYPQKKYSFISRLNFINNKFTGNSSTPVAFQMLEGLQTGKNIVFEMFYKQKLSSYLEMNLKYNFRISENNPAVHTGGIQLRMIF